MGRYCFLTCFILFPLQFHCSVTERRIYFLHEFPALTLCPYLPVIMCSRLEGTAAGHIGLSLPISALYSFIDHSVYNKIELQLHKEMGLKTGGGCRRQGEITRDKLVLLHKAAVRKSQAISLFQVKLHLSSSLASTSNELVRNWSGLTQTRSTFMLCVWIEFKRLSHSESVRLLEITKWL